MTRLAGGEPPPGVARRVVRWVVGPDEADMVEGELAEGYRDRAARDGVATARFWYRRQVMGFVLRSAEARRLTKREVGMGWWSEVAGDVRWALRGLRKRPTFAAVAVATLALGIGSNSAIFTLVSAHFLAPLPYDRPEALALVWETDRRTGEVMTVAPGNYYALRESARTLVDVAAFNVNVATISGDGDAERVTASVVTPAFFDVLGARAEFGTTFSEEAVREADGALVVLGHRLWTTRYGADPGIVGRTLRIDGRPFTVVGVMPADFRQPERQLTWQGAQLWRPMDLAGQHDDFGSRFLRTVARLAPGATIEQARVEVQTLHERLSEAHPEDRPWGITVRTLDGYLLGDARPTLLMLLGAGVAVLLIVCANVANLTLARGQERQREFAVRAALGSGQRRLFRQVLVEGVVLAVLGAAVGTAGVYAANGTLQAVQERYFSGLVDVHVDLRVVGITALVTLLAGVLFALPLARTASRLALRDAMGEAEARGGTSRGTVRLRNLLIVGQVGLATTLLVVSALLTRSFDALVNVPPGFDARGRITFDVYAPRSAYPETGDVVRYLREVEREVASVPGVADVTMTSDLPFTNENRWTLFGVDGGPFDEQAAPRADMRTVLPGYFRVMGIPMLAGSVFEQAWGATDGEVPVLVNARMASIVAPDGGDVVGRGIFTFFRGARTPYRVVGVVGNELDDGYDAAPEPILYLPWGASPDRGMSVVVRVDSDVAAALRGVRGAVGRVDPDIPAADLRPLEALMAETVVRPRAASRIGAAFALLALLVAAAGIYGVLSYAVQSRTREIGIRAALGADGRRLMRMVLGQSTRLLVAGLALGLAGALAAGGALSGLLFGVRAWDPLSLAGAVAALGSVGTLAAWLPARRAVRIDPKEALRSE